jgi:hypothetical protein
MWRKGRGSKKLTKDRTSFNGRPWRTSKKQRGIWPIIINLFSILTKFQFFLFLHSKLEFFITFKKSVRVNWRFTILAFFHSDENVEKGVRGKRNVDRYISVRLSSPDRFWHKILLLENITTIWSFLATGFYGKPWYALRKHMTHHVIDFFNSLDRLIEIFG